MADFMSSKAEAPAQHNLMVRYEVCDVDQRLVDNDRLLHGRRAHRTGRARNRL